MTSLWIAWREVRGRRNAFLLSVSFVAAAVAISTGLALAGRAREAAVSEQMDRVAPGIRIVSTGLTSTDLRRLDLGHRLLPPTLPQQVANALAERARHIEARLVIRKDIAGREVPVVGVAESDRAHAFVGKDQPRSHAVVVGTDLGRRLGAARTLTLWGRQWTVARMLPRRGTLDDRTLFVSLRALQQALAQPGRINELRVYPHAMASIPRIADALRRQHADVAVFESADRRGSAEVDTEAVLADHRHLVHLLTSVAVAIALFVSALLEVRDRHGEVAMLIAVGARRRTVVTALVGRFTLAALVGSAVGLALAVAAVLVQDPGTLVIMPWPWEQIAVVASITLAASAAAVAPAAIFAVARDHTRALQG